MKNHIKNRIHISSIGENSAELAREAGLGLEIAEFCWAYHLDNGFLEKLEKTRELMRGIGSFWFHAPFAELSPCAIDPCARELAAFRYRQAIDAASELGVNRLVIHGGYIPQVYYPEYYVESAIDFYKGFLASIKTDVMIALENVMEPSPDTLVAIVNGVDDPRLGLCLDVGHANCNVSSLPPQEWIAPMKERLFHVHLHNNLGDKDLHLPLGEGVIDMEGIMDTLAEACPNATFTVENQYPRASIDWLHEKGYI